MTEMLNDVMLARRVQATGDRKRPHANSDDERHAVRPRATQEDGAENPQSSAEPLGDGNRDQSGSGEMQVEGEAKRASSQRVKRLAEVVSHSDTRAPSSERSSARQRHGYEQHRDE